jgi:hypothetical protein
VVPGAQVFFYGAGGILDGHVPTAEINHATAHTAVHSIKRRSFQLWGDLTHAYISDYFTSQNSWTK